MFLKTKNIVVIENDIRLLKFNFKSRRNYTIKEILLEKKLIHNSVIRVRITIAYEITDLEACYDR